MRKRKDKPDLSREEARKIIYLDKRGKSPRSFERDAFEQAGIPVGTWVAGAIAVLCLVYFLVLLLWASHVSLFSWIWAAMSLFFGILAGIFAQDIWRERCPRWGKRALGVIGICCLLLFCVVDGCIFSKWQAKAQPGADYMIILGARWNSSGPSYVLKKRLDMALDYLTQNPECYVIVSGGQGKDEAITEAAGMQRYLTERGIAANRIRLEEEATNTEENLLLSAALVDPVQDRIVVVTSRFHMYRALHIARQCGYERVEGLSADSHLGMLPNDLLRESCAILKEWIRAIGQ